MWGLAERLCKSSREREKCGRREEAGGRGLPRDYIAQDAQMLTSSSLRLLSFAALMKER